jgi:hypothetical protein
MMQAMVDLRDRRWKLGIAAALLVLLAGWWLLDRRVSVQAPATFARIKQAIDDGDGADVVAELHSRYSFSAMWPGRFDRSETQEGLDSSDARTMAKRGLYVLFHSSGVSMRMAYTIKHVEERPDGTVAVDVVLEVGSANGGRQVLDPTKTHRFVLARDGWISGKLRVLSHDPIEVTLP